MISAHDIVVMQDRLTRAWHVPPEEGEDVEAPPHRSDRSDEDRMRDDWLELMTRQHRANFDLWHIEDEARAPFASDADLAAVKRRIDATNQLRNDLVEVLDRMLLTWLRMNELPNPEAALHSETPGLIIDRLSILSLKIYHTREETRRRHAPLGHDERNRERLAILERQRRDLTGCLGELWRDILAGQRRFELYRQLKMYNDPALNPAIYEKKETGSDENTPS